MVKKFGYEQRHLKKGIVMLSDGRYLPPKETVACCYNTFGAGIGLLDNWEQIYDNWING